MLVTIGKLNIYNSSDHLIGTAILPSTYVKPNEIKKIRSLINQKLPQGFYKTQTIVYFSSGFVEKNSTMLVEYKPTVKLEEKPDFSWILFVIIIIVVMILAYYWYKRD
ncbi:MAG: hypothetical protein QXM38_01365 [Candidatus Aenigmatarchaeota archaeon]